MLNMLIVDDESIIRRGIKTAIDWSSYGINIIGEAKNGKEALDIALNLQPHIVLSDIRMPIMNGLEFAKKLKEAIPHTKIVILSGYDDFEYAKEAIRINVDEYILKPFGSDELIRLIMTLKDKILKEQTKHAHALRTQTILQENTELLQFKLIHNLLKESYDDYTYIKENASLIHMNLDGPMYQVMLIDIDDAYLIMEDMTSREKDQLKNTVLNIMLDIATKTFNCTFCLGELNYYIGLMNTDTDTQLPILDACKKIKTTIQQQLKITVTIALGNTYSHIKDIRLSYNEALIALRQKIHKGKNSIIHFKQSNSINECKTISHPMALEKELLNALQDCNETLVKKTLTHIFSNLKDGYALEEQVKNTCTRLLLLSIYTLEVMGIHIKRELGKELNIYAHIKKYETIDDMHRWLEQLFHKFIDSIHHYKNQKYKQIVHIAIDYIEENYNENITLKSLADVVYVTPNYLSKVFKEETGQNFVEWLNIYRIEKSKKLLKDVKYKTYEVAHRVGYSDYKIFSYNFKKYVGQSPREYRKSAKPLLFS